MIIQSTRCIGHFFYRRPESEASKPSIIMGAYQAIKSIVRSRFNSSTSADLRAYPETRSALLRGAVFGLVALSRLPTDPPILSIRRPARSEALAAVLAARRSEG